MDLEPQQSRAFYFPHFEPAKCPLTFSNQLSPTITRGSGGHLPSFHHSWSSSDQSHSSLSGACQLLSWVQPWIIVECHRSPESSLKLEPSLNNNVNHSIFNLYLYWIPGPNCPRTFCFSHIESVKCPPTLSYQFPSTITRGSSGNLPSFHHSLNIIIII